MRRLFVVLLLVLLAAASFAYLVRLDAGYVLIEMHGYTVETTAWVAALLVLVGLVAFYYLGRVLVLLADLLSRLVTGRSRRRPGLLERWHARRRSHTVRGVLAFRILGRQLDFVRLKYVCYGVAQAMDWESRRLLDNPEQVQVLLEAVAALKHEPRRFINCCRGLHASWLQAGAADFPLTPPARQGLEKLRRFLVSASPALPPELRIRP